MTVSAPAQLTEYLRLTRFHRPAGALLLLWPTLWGLWLAAEGFPGWRLLAIFVCGVFASRALGCVLNDFADRKLDAQVARTRSRPLAAKTVSPREAAWVAAFFAAACFALWLMLPSAAMAWGLISLAALAAYPMAKRIIAAPQAALGVAFSLGLFMAFAAVHESFVPPALAWQFAAANWLWVMAYDTIYAMCDRADDIRAGAKSSAILFGRHDLTAVGIFYSLAIFLLSALGLLHWPDGVAYQTALVAAMLLVFRFWFLCRERDPARCFLAFSLNHWFGAFVFAGLAATFA